MAPISSLSGGCVRSRRPTDRSRHQVRQEAALNWGRRLRDPAADIPHFTGAPGQLTYLPKWKLERRRRFGKKRKAAEWELEAHRSFAPNHRFCSHSSALFGFGLWLELCPNHDSDDVNEPFERDWWATQVISLIARSRNVSVTRTRKHQS